MQKSHVLGEIRNTEPYCRKSGVQKAGDCTQKGLKASLFFTNQSIKASLTAQSCVQSDLIKVCLWVAAAASFSRNTSALPLLFTPSFLGIKQYVNGDLDFDLGKMWQNSVILMSGCLEALASKKQRKGKLSKTFQANLQQIYRPNSTLAVSPPEDRRCALSFDLIHMWPKTVRSFERC